MYKVSVVMPIYNNENTLKQAIESILNQSLYSLELILIDDGSTDDSSKICKEYAKKEPLIIEYISQSKMGFGVARNKGLFKAKGEFIYFASANDQFDYKMLEANVALAEEREADLVVFGFKDQTQMSLEGTAYHLPRLPHLSSHKSFRNHYRNFHHFHPYALHNKIYRKKYLFENRIKFYSVPLQEAAFFNLNVYNNLSQVAFNRTSYYQHTSKSSIKDYQENLFKVNVKLAKHFEGIMNVWGYEEEFHDLIVFEYFQALFLEIENLCRPLNPMTFEEQENYLLEILNNEQMQDVLNDPILFKNQTGFMRSLLVTLRNKNSKLALRLVSGRKETKKKTFKLSRWLRKRIGK